MKISEISQHQIRATFDRRQGKPKRCQQTRVNLTSRQDSLH